MKDATPTTFGNPYGCCPLKETATRPVTPSTSWPRPGALGESAHEIAISVCNQTKQATSRQSSTPVYHTRQTRPGQAAANAMLGGPPAGLGADETWLVARRTGMGVPQNRHHQCRRRYYH
eukprot:6207628-Pleurochrysis_carterae.AAC.1